MSYLTARMVLSYDSTAAASTGSPANLIMTNDDLPVHSQTLFSSPAWWARSLKQKMVQKINSMYNNVTIPPYGEKNNTLKQSCLWNNFLKDLQASQDKNCFNYYTISGTQAKFWLIII